MKTQICRLCGTSFVPGTSNQQYCDECYLPLECTQNNTKPPRIKKKKKEVGLCLE